MDKLKQKYDQLIKALGTLEEALNSLHALIERGKAYNPNTYYETEYKTYRDSAIQRFEYCADLFWKYLKKHLEMVHLVLHVHIPSEVIRTAFALELIEENEAETILAMLKSRNLTSHTYVEEIAEQLIKKIPLFYKTAYAITTRLH